VDAREHGVARLPREERDVPAPPRAQLALQDDARGEVEAGDHPQGRAGEEARRRRVALCKLLLEAPDMLLLDEPTNHLDAESIAWLQKHLIAYKGTILIVTHDRYFLDDITSWILELDRGRGIPYEGNYSAWLDQKAKRMAQEQREDKSKQKALEKELEWIRSGTKARQSKGKARLSRYNEMAGQTVLERSSSAQIIIPNGERLGHKVIEVEGISKSMGDRLLIENLSFTVPPGAIVGVIGPNGAGKSTLFRMITGGEQPDSGSITLGNTVQLAYVDKLDHKSKHDTEEIVRRRFTHQRALDKMRVLYSRVLDYCHPAPKAKPSKAALQQKAELEAAQQVDAAGGGGASSAAG
jgi:ATPase subunit of ABC transporter with duplicated ATPase domains